MNKKRLIGLIAGLALILVAGGALATGFLTRDLSGTMEYVETWRAVSGPSPLTVKGIFPLT